VKNVTITVDEDVLAWARVQAAEQGVSLSRFVGEVIGQQMGRDSSYAAAMHRYFASEFVFRRKSGARYLTREETHDRAGLRRR
jgi:hypothetical protein